MADGMKTPGSMLPDKGLAPFEGLPVISAGMEIPGASGGLRDALSVEPREFHHEAECYVVFQLRVRKVRFDPIKDVDALQRVHVMDIVSAAFVSHELVADELERQQLKLEEARRGPTLPGMAPGESGEPQGE